MKDYEKSLDEDDKLLREYERLREIKQQHQDRLKSPNSKSPRELNLKEVGNANIQRPSVEKKNK
jgi:hypothetical protein